MFLLVIKLIFITCQKSFRLLYSEICSYSIEELQSIMGYDEVFVSYIRRYVLTVDNEDYGYFEIESFRLLYSEICSY